MLRGFPGGAGYIRFREKSILYIYSVPIKRFLRYFHTAEGSRNPTGVHTWFIRK